MGQVKKRVYHFRRNIKIKNNKRSLEILNNQNYRDFIFIDDLVSKFLNVLSIIYIIKY